MKAPENLKYTKEHEWVKIDGTKAYIGITDHAQHSLGDIVFMELPQKGKELKAGDSIGVVESVKAVSDVYCPLSGRVIDVNEVLIDAPEKVNTAPYDNWMVIVEIADESEIEGLLSAEQYQELCLQEG